MAILRELNIEEWREWLKSRPPIIKKMAERCPPNRLYRLKSTGQRVTLYSYSEDGTVTVNVTGEYNAVSFDSRVFGIEIGSLEECGLPGPEEEVGTLLTEEKDIKEYIDWIRPHILQGHKTSKRDQ